MAGQVAIYRGYLARLTAGGGRRPDGRPVLWEWHAEDGDPWRAGDLMTGDFIARAYAAYLDAGMRP
jgi:hypothetical protein